MSRVLIRTIKWGKVNRTFPDKELVEGRSEEYEVEKRLARLLAVRLEAEVWATNLWMLRWQSWCQGNGRVFFSIESKETISVRKKEKER
jgi:hypothetical protein